MIDVQQYVGVPFVWGGTSPVGFDCAGFTQYIMKQHGIMIPRTVAEQFNTGTEINASSLQAGDLVFFTFYMPGPTHVGICMSKRKFIHASRSDGEQVAISLLNDPYYAVRYVGARRYMSAAKEGD